MDPSGESWKFLLISIIVPRYVWSPQPEISSHLITGEKQERLICSQDPPLGCKAAEGKCPCPILLSVTAA